MQSDIKLPPPVSSPPPHETELPRPDANLPAPQPQQKKTGLSWPKDSSRKWWIAALIIGIALLLVAAVIAWGFWQLQPRTSEGAQRRVVITSGSTLADAAGMLEREGIIRNALVFRIYVMVQGEGLTLKAGSYTLSPTQSVAEIVQYLHEGRVEPLRITIPPGQTLNQIRTLLMRFGFSEASVNASLSASYNHPLLASKPASTSLEGYIFPDTYELPGDGQVRSLITLSFDTLEEKLNQNGLRQALEAQGLNVHQALTLASIVQKEDKRPEEQRRIAQVFLKRLKENMPLGSDVTFMYAAEQMGVEPSVNLQSPYNTRLHKGLPPGPIGNFNLTALEAIAFPAPGDFLYFVAGDDGVNYFARTLQEHERNVAAHCSNLCR